MREEQRKAMEEAAVENQIERKKMQELKSDIKHKDLAHVYLNFQIEVKEIREGGV